jgi:hypothetical protein
MHQANALSPVLFKIVMDMLAILTERAELNVEISGIVPHMVDDDLSILWYTDDVVISWIMHELEKAKNLNWCHVLLRNFPW